MNLNIGDPELDRRALALECVGLDHSDATGAAMAGETADYSLIETADLERLAANDWEAERELEDRWMQSESRKVE